MGALKNIFDKTLPKVSNCTVSFHITTLANPMVLRENAYHSRIGNRDRKKRKRRRQTG